MQISFSPQRRDDTLSLERTAPDRLRINGELFNFGPLADGDTIPAGAVPCDWITGPVERIDGEIHLTLILPHGLNPDQHVAFPEPITVSENGPVDLFTTTTQRWRQPDGVDTVFVANPESEPDTPEEADHVEP